ncbi:DUF1844 domain-containing protein [Candidatus Dependentiae bacterium]|nr:DUF1844 domain-containing protein [Candidatus Dependentiae bacterium]
MSSEESMHSFLFIMLVRQYESSAYQFMGKVANPFSGKVERNLDTAKTFIDILLMLKDKTKGNLSTEEDKVLEVTLTNLQLNYMSELDKPAEEKKEKKPASEKTEPVKDAQEEKKEEEVIIEETEPETAPEKTGKKETKKKTKKTTKKKKKKEDKS